MENRWSTGREVRATADPIERLVPRFPNELPSHPVLMHCRRLMPTAQSTNVFEITPAALSMLVLPAGKDFADLNARHVVCDAAGIRHEPRGCFGLGCPTCLW